ncbi:DNA gyrase C-terminal beta-propeller domain-containing protein [Candidatus Nardonella dryophthoridicola]|uniref:DNA gyrase C-terminal beta-propeller domain-containing protein n=1 Tax=Candidatus Nardonella dryophthoridicola TaxID=1971485 RepID=UPI002A4E140E|nr:DNA gyrase C-terminal beta-propeller domain-containing protein [Candidatus Nardonella dryophthoridicola]
MKFNENKIKLTQRNSYGVKSIKLQNNDKVISLDIIKNNEYILTITENGYGKKTKESEYNENQDLH